MEIGEFVLLGIIYLAIGVRVIYLVKNIIFIIEFNLIKYFK